MKPARLLPNLLLAAFSLALTLVLAEFALRMVFPRNTSDRISSIEYRHDFRMNSDGFRDGEFAPKAAKGRRGIAFVGDSFTAGMGSELPDTFASLLAARLAPEAETFNLGRVITGTKAHCELLAKYLEPLHADTAVLFFYWNDVQDNFYYDEEYADTAAMVRAENARKRPFFVFLEPVKSSVRDSVLYRFLSVYYRIFLSSRGVSKLDYDLEMDYFEKESASASVRRSWEVTDKLLEDMKRVCTEQSAKLIVVYVPKREQLIGWERLVSFYRVDGAFYDRFQVNRRLAETLKRLGVPFVDVSAKLDALPDKEKLYYRFDTHFTPAGNRAFFDAFAPELLPLLETKQ